MGEPVSASHELFGLIAACDARFRTLGVHLPQEPPPVERWAGVLFRVRGLRLLVPLGQVAEVLDLPHEMTPVPGIKDWVLGVANNRGTLLPVFDLAALVHGGAPVRGDKDRVLVIRQEELPCGLAVSEAICIRHCDAVRQLAEPPGGLGVLQPFAQGAFALEEGAVAVIALDRLLTDPLLSLGSA